MPPLLSRGVDDFIAVVTASFHRKRTTGTAAKRTACVAASAPEERTAGVTASALKERTAGVAASAPEERTAGVTASASAFFFASPPPPAACQPSPPSDLRHNNHTEMGADTARIDSRIE